MVGHNYFAMPTTSFYITSGISYKNNITQQSFDMNHPLTSRLLLYVVPNTLDSLGMGLCASHETEAGVMSHFEKKVTNTRNKPIDEVVATKMGKSMILPAIRKECRLNQVNRNKIC